MLILLIICLWFLVGLLAGAAVTYWLDKDDIVFKDMVYLSCLGGVTVLAAMLYLAIKFKEKYITFKPSGRLKRLWNKTLIRR